MKDFPMSSFFAAGMIVSVCWVGWDKLDGNVLCRQLGYPGAFAAVIFPRRKGEVNSLYWLNDINCYGTESSIQV